MSVSSVYGSLLCSFYDAQTYNNFIRYSELSRNMYWCGHSPLEHNFFFDESVSIWIGRRHIRISRFQHERLVLLWLKYESSTPVLRSNRWTIGSLVTAMWCTVSIASCFASFYSRGRLALFFSPWWTWLRKASEKCRISAYITSLLKDILTGPVQAHESSWTSSSP